MQNQFKVGEIYRFSYFDNFRIFQEIMSINANSDPPSIVSLIEKSSNSQKSDYPNLYTPRLTFEEMLRHQSVPENLSPNSNTYTENNLSGVPLLNKISAFNKSTRNSLEPADSSSASSSKVSWVLCYQVYPW